MKRILTGLKPSGELTLGSLIGGISQMVKYQEDYESFMFVPDLHAITVEQDPIILKERIRKKNEEKERKRREEEERIKKENEENEKERIRKENEEFYYINF